MNLFVRKLKFKIKVPPPLYYDNNKKLSYLLLILAVILVNGITCSDTNNYVRTTAQPQMPQRPSSQQQHSGGGSIQSSGSHAVENVHKMLSHAMTETINNEFGSEYFYLYVLLKSFVAVRP